MREPASSFINRRRVVLAGAAAWAVPWASGAARAEGFPSQPLTIVVPYPAGGASDIDARRIGVELARRLGQPVVIENVTGAVGTLGVRKALRAAADGHTLLYGSLQETVLMPIVSANAGYRTEDMSAIAVAGVTPATVVVRPDFPADDMAGLIELLGRQPGRFTYGTAGVGSFFHFVSETIKLKTGVFAVHIPYRGGPPVVADLLGGQIDIGITAAPNVVGLVRQGRLKALGVSSADRLPALAAVPAFSETPALKGLDMSIWGMLLAPKGLPDSTARMLNQAINEIAEMPAIVEQRSASGSGQPPRLSVSQAQAFLLRERDAYRQTAGRMRFT
ncbi:MAG: tripartite tricarboxylate transporter substrate binding protein [Burkholderiales bacterium]|nr:MAG: tripartite tricarboxylate transporter substrate binding protein [Burkholderiales bacterium]